MGDVAGAVELGAVGLGLVVAELAVSGAVEAGSDSLVVLVGTVLDLVLHAATIATSATLSQVRGTVRTVQARSKTSTNSSRPLSFTTANPFDGSGMA